MLTSFRLGRAVKVAGSIILIGVIVIGYYSNRATRQIATHEKGALESENTMYSFHNNKIITPYGTFEVGEPVIFDLIQSAAFQRIRHIHQYGIMRWVKNSPEYSRYSHCLGVWAILRRFGAPLNEQLAGLLHDVSHTVFSHLGDHIFNHNSARSSYQDDIHEWFLRKYSIDKILLNHGIELRDVLHKSDRYKMLEQDLPELCADRIEYNLRGGLIEGLISKEEIEEILAALRFDEGRWFFVDQEAALKFAKIPLHLTVHEWGSPGNHLAYAWAAKAVRRGLELQVITFDEVHFSTDDIIWERLTNATDSAIQGYMDKVIHYKYLYEVVENPAGADKIFNTKFRGVNPWVMLDDEYKRLTEVNRSFNSLYADVLEKVKRGWPVKFAKGIEAGI